MRLAQLYLRSRLTGWSLVAMALIALLAIVWSHWLSDEPDAMTAALILFPLTIACIIGAGTHSPFGEAEQTASLSLPVIRSIQIAGLIAAGGMALLMVALRWSLPDDGGILLRNLLGLVGLALLMAPVVGGRLAWVGPVTLAMLSLLLAASETTTSLLLTWPHVSYENGRALVIALALLGIGLAFLHAVGPKLERDETH